MLYSEYILQLRNQVGDTRRRAHVDWVGDGATMVFQMPDDTFPVLDQTASYVVKVDGANKTEGTNYSLDKDSGTLIFIDAAPAINKSVTIDCSAVHLTDASWLSIIGATINSMGDNYFKEFVDETSVSTSNITSLSLASAKPFCIAVYEFSYRPSSASDWLPVSNIANWRYSKDENKLYIGTREAFPSAGIPFRVRGLNAIQTGTAVGDTIDCPAPFMTVVEYGTLARYWRWRYKNVVELVSKMTQENTRTPLQELIMLADRFDRLFETEKNKLKPQRPSRIIPSVLQGGGRP